MEKHDVEAGYKGCAPLAGFMNEDRFTFTPADWGFDRYAPANVTSLELRYVINAVLTDCASAGRRMLAASHDNDAAARHLADAVPQIIQFEGTQKDRRGQVRALNLKTYELQRRRRQLPGGQPGRRPVQALAKAARGAGQALRPVHRDARVGAQERRERHALRA